MPAQYRWTSTMTLLLLHEAQRPENLVALSVYGRAPTLKAHAYKRIARTLSLEPTRITLVQRVERRFLYLRNKYRWLYMNARILMFSAERQVPLVSFRLARFPINGPEPNGHPVDVAAWAHACRAHPYFAIMHVIMQ
ncbi:hypothetical protein BDV93DRAFT_557718 [Ceratobasidium sp. AG-I]|nr:hypothetical protein BDV93DRAFT_557718 [Ceratobasidium sp. AG-I]